MTKKPADHSWQGFTEEQGQLLDTLDFYGNNDWSRNTQSDIILPKLMGELHEVGLSIGQIQQAMQSLGYHKGAIHQLARWESKHITGKFEP